eukprot:1137070-Pelagomonas_calceolata.AAC.1
MCEVSAARECYQGTPRGGASQVPQNPNPIELLRSVIPARLVEGMGSIVYEYSIYQHANTLTRLCTRPDSASVVFLSFFLSNKTQRPQLAKP